MTRTQMTGIGLAGALLVAAAGTQAQSEGRPAAARRRRGARGLGRREEEHPGVRRRHAGGEVHVQARTGCGRSDRSSPTLPARTMFSARPSRGRSRRRPKTPSKGWPRRPQSSRRGMNR